MRDLEAPSASWLASEYCEGTQVLMSCNPVLFQTRVANSNSGISNTETLVSRILLDVEGAVGERIGVP